MRKAAFLADPSVGDFIDWLASTLPSLSVCLTIGPSRFVPGGIRVHVNGIDAVLSQYRWKSTGMVVGDWAETQAYLAHLGSALQAAVRARKNRRAWIVCRSILQWGGNRNPRKGAFQFLQEKAAAGSLCHYIAAAGRTLQLATADTNRTGPIMDMNSMLTKVHALYATDGLPIYDSRVAAAIASLVELWRASRHTRAQPLPKALSFPATSSKRTVFCLFPRAPYHPGVMSYGAANTAAAWSNSKIRLGWVMEAVLQKKTELFAAEGTLQNRMHAFEASLFMIGYDVACLVYQITAIRESPCENVTLSQAPRVERQNSAELNTDPILIIPDSSCR